jgi:hypothetical protein
MNGKASPHFSQHLFVQWAMMVTCPRSQQNQSCEQKRSRLSLHKNGELAFWLCGFPDGEGWASELTNRSVNASSSQTQPGTGSIRVDALDLICRGQELRAVPA